VICSCRIGTILEWDRSGLINLLAFRFVLPRTIAFKVHIADTFAATFALTFGINFAEIRVRTRCYFHLQIAQE